MLPRLLEFGSFGLPTYGVMAALGLILGLTINVLLARREGMDPEKAWDLGILVIFSAIFGAKLLFVATEWSYFSRHPREIFSVATLQAGGIFYGGLLAALAVSVWYLRRHRLPWLKTADIFAPGVAAGHALGRLGCFAAGCCYGRPTDLPWGATFTSNLAHNLVGTPLGIPLHPTQIYESLLELGNFLILMWLFKRRSFDGQIMGAYLFLYGLGRYFLEFLRDDPGRGVVFGGAMSGTQLISIGMVITGGLLWLRRGEARAAATDAAR